MGYIQSGPADCLFTYSMKIMLTLLVQHRIYLIYFIIGLKHQHYWAETFVNYNPIQVMVMLGIVPLCLLV